MRHTRQQSHGYEEYKRFSLDDAGYANSQTSGYLGQGGTLAIRILAEPSGEHELALRYR